MAPPYPLLNMPGSTDCYSAMRRSRHQALTKLPELHMVLQEIGVARYLPGHLGHLWRCRFEAAPNASGLMPLS